MPASAWMQHKQSACVGLSSSCLLNCAHTADGRHHLDGCAAVGCLVVIEGVALAHNQAAEAVAVHKAEVPAAGKAGSDSGGGGKQAGGAAGSGEGGVRAGGRGEGEGGGGELAVEEVGKGSGRSAGLTPATYNRQPRCIQGKAPRSNSDSNRAAHRAPPPHLTSVVIESYTCAQRFITEAAVKGRMMGPPAKRR